MTRPTWRSETKRAIRTTEHFQDLTDTLTSPNILTEGQWLTSRSKQFSAGINSTNGVGTGELVIKDEGVISWRVGAMDGRMRQLTNPSTLSFTNEGDLILVKGVGNWNAGTYWRSGTTATPKLPNRLVMQDDRNLVLYDATGKVVWSSGTNVSIPKWLSPRCIQANECVYDPSNKFRACHLPDGGFAIQTADGSDTRWNSRPRVVNVRNERVPDGYSCPPGTREWPPRGDAYDPTGECMSDTYGRGAGKPMKSTSSIGYIPQQSFEHGGPGTPWHKRWDRGTAIPKRRWARPTATPKKQMVRDRGAGMAWINCNGQFPSREGGLCYRRCPEGSKGVGPLCWKDSCNSDEEERTPGLCYKKCPDGYRDNGDLTACWQIKCDDDRVEKTGGLCYKKCPEGWHETADLTACWKQACEPDEEKSGALCYKRCPEGTRRIANTCWRDKPCKGHEDMREVLGVKWCHPKCPEGYKRDGGGSICYSCGEGHEKWGLLCYPKCNDGFEPVGCCLCQPKGGPRVTALPSLCKPNEYYEYSMATGATYQGKCVSFQTKEQGPVKGPSKTCLQEDGNLVSYDGDNKPYWSAQLRPQKKGKFEGEVSEDRTFSILDQNGETVWKTDTIKPDATDDFAVPRETDMPGIGACTMRAGPDGQCCAGIMCKGGALFDFCAKCYTRDGRPSTKGCFELNPSATNDFDTTPAYKTCKGCTLLDEGRRMGCWCKQSTDPLSPPWHTQWSEISLEGDKMKVCKGVEGTRVLRNMDGNLTFECSKFAAHRHVTDADNQEEKWTNIMNFALDPGGEADKAIRTAKLFEKDTTTYLPTANHEKSWKVTPIMRKGQHGDGCWWVNAAGKTTNECAACYDDKGKPSDHCPIGDFQALYPGPQCAGCTWDGTTLGCWCLTGRDAYDTEWKTLAKDSGFEEIQKSPVHTPVARYLHSGRLTWTHGVPGSRVPLGNGAVTCIAHDNKTACTSVPGKPGTIKCNFGDGTESPEYTVPVSCDLDKYPHAHVSVDRSTSPDTFVCNTGVTRNKVSKCAVTLPRSTPPTAPTVQPHMNLDAVIRKPPKPVDACPRPAHWCKHAGATLREVDCLGDGVVGDHICEDTAGNRGTILRSDRCGAKWPAATGCTDNRSTANKHAAAPPPPPPPPPPPKEIAVTTGSVLESPNHVPAGACITSRKGHRFCMQKDGNVVMYDVAGRPRWDSGTSSPNPAKLSMQADGNLVAYNAGGGVIWASNTSGRTGQGPFRLVVQDDGNVVLLDSSRVATWATATTDPPPENAVTSGPKLTSPDYIPAGACITSRKGHRFCMQKDGNVVMYDVAGRPRWDSGTSSPNPAKLSMQADGNLVAYNAGGGVIWASNTSGRTGQGPFTLAARDDGIVAVFDSRPMPIWNTRTKD